MPVSDSGMCVYEKRGSVTINKELFEVLFSGRKDYCSNA